MEVVMIKSNIKKQFSCDKINYGRLLQIIQIINGEQNYPK